ncbi:hypothetical protein HDU88_007956 [Geranomyces variabilis]|nr:hypothetical protein HDU88_007956 [Geranomyces variabilis]
MKRSSQEKGTDAVQKFVGSIDFSGVQKSKNWTTKLLEQHKIKLFKHLQAVLSQCSEDEAGDLQFYVAESPAEAVLRTELGTLFKFGRFICSAGHVPDPDSQETLSWGTGDADSPVDFVFRQAAEGLNDGTFLALGIRYPDRKVQVRSIFCATGPDLSTVWHSWSCKHADDAAEAPCLTKDAVAITREHPKEWNPDGALAVFKREGMSWVPGDSGSMITFTIPDWNLHCLGYMVIARDKADHGRALAISMPRLMGVGLKFLRLFEDHFPLSGSDDTYASVISYFLRYDQERKAYDEITQWELIQAESTTYFNADVSPFFKERPKESILWMDKFFVEKDLRNELHEAIKKWLKTKAGTDHTAVETLRSTLCRHPGYWKAYREAKVAQHNQFHHKCQPKFFPDKPKVGPESIKSLPKKLLKADPLLQRNTSVRSGSDDEPASSSTTTASESDDNPPQSLNVLPATPYDKYILSQIKYAGKSSHYPTALRKALLFAMCINKAGKPEADACWILPYSSGNNPDFYKLMYEFQERPDVNSYTGSGGDDNLWKKGDILLSSPEIESASSDACKAYEYWPHSLHSRWTNDLVSTVGPLHKSHHPKLCESNPYAKWGPLKTSIENAEKDLAHKKADLEKARLTANTNTNSDVQTAQKAVDTAKRTLDKALTDAKARHRCFRPSHLHLTSSMVNNSLCKYLQYTEPLPLYYEPKSDRDLAFYMKQLMISYAKIRKTSVPDYAHELVDAAVVLVETARSASGAPAPVDGPIALALASGEAVDKSDLGIPADAFLRADTACGSPFDTSRLFISQEMREKINDLNKNKQETPVTSTSLARATSSQAPTAATPAPSKGRTMKAPK